VSIKTRRTSRAESVRSARRERPRCKNRLNARAISERSTCRLHVGNIRYRVAVIARQVSVYHGRRVASRCVASRLLARENAANRCLNCRRVACAAIRSRERRAASTRLSTIADSPLRATRTNSISATETSSWSIARAKTASSCNRYEIRVKTIES